jgi:hypothetical protein
MGRSRLSVVGALVALAVVVAVLTGLRPDSGSAAPTPTAVPTVGWGHICFSSEPSIDSCADVASGPTFVPGQKIAFRIEMPFSKEDWIHVQVSRLDGSTASVVKELDIQVIPNPDGDWGSLGAVAALRPSTGPSETLYWVDAYSADRHIAQGYFMVAVAESSPS